MCSELLRIPYVWGGVPIFGAGVLLVVWAVAGVISLGQSVRRHGLRTETWSTLLLVALAGAAIWGLPRIFADGLPIRGFGLMVLLGSTAGISLVIWRVQRLGLDQETILSLAFWVFICGIVGARLFYVIEYWDERFRFNNVRTLVFEVLNFPEGGLVIYGALIGASIAFFAFVRRHRLPLLALSDLVAPSLVVGLAFGRIGCLLNGCCFGGPTTLPWAVTFPPGSPPYQQQLASGEMLGVRLVANSSNQVVVDTVERQSPAAEAGLAVGDVVISINSTTVDSPDFSRARLADLLLSQQPATLELASGRTVDLSVTSLPLRSRPVHPTQIYSAINAGLLAWFLYAYYPHRRREGETTALLLTIYPISRFMLEVIRTDESPVFGTGMSISQNISVAVVVMAVGLWYYLSRQPRQLVWTPQRSS